jgi:hypothetical protein
VKQKIKQFSGIVLLSGIVFSFYSIYSFFADDYSMIDEEYAREAMRIVQDSSPPANDEDCTANK